MINILIALLSIFLIIYFFLLIDIYKDIYKKTIAYADAAVVLGAKSHIGSSINTCLDARVDQGVSLYKRGFAKKLIFTGGVDRGERVSEGELMQKIAVEKGALLKDIFLEKKSESTYENLVFTKKIMEQKKIKTVILVSDPYYLKRVDLIAKKLGLIHSLSPALNSPCWRNSKYLSSGFLLEPLHIILYKITGKI